MTKQIITASDWLLLPVYIGFILLIAAMIRSRFEHALDKKYFMWGLYAKLFGAIAFALIYVYNYGGGDTINYWHSAKCFINLSHENFPAFWQLMKGSMEPEFLYSFTSETGYPAYRHDPQAFAVNRFMVPFVWLGAKRFLLSTVVLSFFIYLVIFRFYRFLSRLYPDYRQIAGIAVLFVPSILIWSSGILKDSLTFAFALLAVVALYNLFVKPHQWIRYLLYLVFSAHIIISIKPYIFYALLAAAMVWLLAAYTIKIKAKFVRVFVMPLLAVLFIVAGIFTFSRLGDTVGGYYTDMDAMAEQAYIIQDDLSKDYYGGNSFDIGGFEPTMGGMLSKAPQAIVAGLYRPFLWEAGNILMIFSGLENFVLLLLSLFIIFRIGPLNFIKQLSKEPFLIFAIVFAVVLSFFIGLTTANFGALVRYRIPLLPFF
ncbi:MAG: hypothetical protein U9N51_04405, partial [Bacteroidota bacterium]|nr:hypothetical protein [Bacteroidota bacterium]